MERQRALLEVAESGEVPGWLVLANHDRYPRGVAMHPRGGVLTELSDSVFLAYGKPVGGFVRRQGRLMALYRVDGRLAFRCGRATWDVEEASVRRRVVWPVHVLRFEQRGRTVGSCRFLDWELARRGFFSGLLDITGSEEFNWSRWVLNVMRDAERRALVGRP